MSQHRSRKPQTPPQRVLGQTLAEFYLHALANAVADNPDGAMTAGRWAWFHWSTRKDAVDGN